MRYDPIKKMLGRFFSGPVFMRKALFFLLDLFLLRTWHVRKALHEVARCFPGQALILDAGSGFGQYTWRMSRMNSQWRITAMDVDRDHVENSRKFFVAAGLKERVNCIQGDLAALNDTEHYDIILSVDVMEHITDDELVFRNFSRAIRPGGILLISTPSDRGGSDVRHKNDHSFIDEHVREGYSVVDITNKLSRAGFHNIETIYTYGKPGNLSWHLSMKYPVKMVNASAAFFALLPFYYLITFPITLVLNIFDVSLTHNSGTGLLVTARK